MKVKTLAALALVAATAGACSSDTSAEPAEAAPTTTAPSVTPTTTLSAEPDTQEPTPNYEPNVGDRALRVGQSREGSAIVTTLREIKLPLTPAQYRDPQPGRQFLGLRLEQCLGKDVDLQGEEVYSSYTGEWYAVAPNGTQVAGDGSSWSDWPTPKFPENVSLLPGDCLKGWIALEVPTGMKVTKMVWRPGGQTTAEWLP